MIASDNMMTLENTRIRPSRSKKNYQNVNRLKIISFTHKTISLKNLGKFFIENEFRQSRLSFLKESSSISEFFYLATCNRIELVFTTEEKCDSKFLTQFFQQFNPDWTTEEVHFAVNYATIYEADAALHHVFSVASSLDSMVVGEREIITQVRKAYDESLAAGQSGDFLRLLMNRTIITAKQVFTQTKIASHPVSVVSLAYRRLRELNASLDAKIIMIGSGETNTNLSKYLTKHGFRNFCVFNRTIRHAEKLAASLQAAGANAKAISLEKLQVYRDGFDVLIACTGASEPIVTTSTYAALLNGDASKKIIIDLGMPSEIDPEIHERHLIHLIDVNKLRSEAEKNLAERQGELKFAEIIIGENIIAFHQLLRIRNLELAMKDVPQKIRDIKNKAIHDVFAREIGTLDENSKQVLGLVLDYMEKKCISVPMLMAKEIILETK